VTIAKRKADSEPIDRLTGLTGGDWLGTGTPFGAVFGSSKAKQYIEVGENAYGATNRTTTTIKFASEVPAGLLGIAIGDLDVDQMVITAKGGDGSTLSGAHLLGSARKVGFNFCNVKSSKPNNCARDTAVPNLLPGRRGGTMKGNGTSTGGSTGWIRPDQPVKSITLTFSAVDSSVDTHTFRLWLAAKAAPAFTG